MRASIPTLVLLSSIGILAGAPPVPVLAELFTSEGCSSCPPADALLETLDRTQPFTGAKLVVLSEHVDYWNGLGWEDPFSSRQFTERQSTYARRFGLDGAYTPQLVINGQFQMVGSDSRAAAGAVAKAAAGEKAEVRIVSVKRDGATAEITVAATPLPKSHRADLWIALAGDRYSSNVRHGENGGRTLNHVSVVHVLRNTGNIPAAGGSHTVALALRPEWTKSLRVIAFLQEPVQGRVLGAAMAMVK